MEVWVLDTCQLIVLVSSDRLAFNGRSVFATRAAALAFLAQHWPELLEQLCWYHPPEREDFWEARHPHQHLLYFSLSAVQVGQCDPAAPEIHLPCARVATTWEEHMRHLQWEEEDA